LWENLKPAVASDRLLRGKRRVSWEENVKKLFPKLGLTPKLLCRVLRFQYARILAQSQSSEQGAIGWAQIAITCGYYDQAQPHPGFSGPFRFDPIAIYSPTSPRIGSRAEASEPAAHHGWKNAGIPHISGAFTT
jgi:hypothetical protein